jgi:hypothetical protein
MAVTTQIRTPVTVTVLGLTGMALVAFLGFQVVTGAIDDAYFRSFVIAPLSAAYGYLLVRSGRTTQVGYALLGIALVSSVLAIVEVAI